MSGPSKFMPAEPAEPPAQAAPPAQQAPANDAPPEPAPPPAPVEAEAAAPTQTSKFTAPAAETPTAATPPATEAPQAPAQPTAEAPQQPIRLYTLDRETTQVQAEVQLLSGTHLSLEQLLDVSAYAREQYRTEYDPAAGFKASLSERGALAQNDHKPGGGGIDALASGLARGLARGLGLGPDNITSEGLCATTAKHENGAKTQVCVNADPVKPKVGMSLGGAF